MKELYRKLIRGKELSLEEAGKIGDTSGINSEFPIKYIIRGDQYLGSLQYRAIIQNITPIVNSKMNLVAKLDALYWIKKEQENNKKAQQKNIPIIKTIEITNIYNLLERKFIQGLIMERFYGETICKLIDSKYYKRAYNLWKKEISDAKRKNIHIRDIHNENVMFNTQTQELVLLDLVSWEFD